MIRFTPDGRLRIESGATLDRSERIDSSRAREAALSGMRVLLWSYPQTTDITADIATVELLTSKVEGPSPTTYGARVYSRGEDRVLVIEHFH